MNQIQIKLIDKDTDISSLKMHLKNWDVVIQNVPYQVADVEGYYHSVESRYGRDAGNSLWAWPLEEQPSYKNMIQYTSKEPVDWGIVYSPCKRIGFYHDNAEMSTMPMCYITRNGDRFSDNCYSIEQALVFISKLKNHPINFLSRDFRDEIIGRKVWWRSEPGIITDWIEPRARVIIKPDGIEKFSTPPEFSDDYYQEDDGDFITTSVFDAHVWWFRFTDEDEVDDEEDEKDNKQSEEYFKVDDAEENETVS